MYILTYIKVKIFPAYTHIWFILVFESKAMNHIQFLTVNWCHDMKCYGSSISTILLFFFNFILFIVSTILISLCQMNTYKWLCFYSTLKWRHALFSGRYCISSHLSSQHFEVDFVKREILTSLSDAGTLKMDRLLKVYFLSLSLRSARLVLTLPKSLCPTCGNNPMLYWLSL